MGSRTGGRPEDLESHLKVGTSVVFQPDPSRETSPRFSTFFRGWERDRYVLLDRIQTGAERVMSLHEGQPCAVRFVHEGKACAFVSTVADWSSRRDASWIRVLWPDELEVVSFRKHDRVKVNLPCRLSRDGEVVSDGEVRDVSIGGCGIVSPLEPPFGDQFRITFDLPNGASIQDAEVVVRNVRRSSDGPCYVGCEFCHGQEHAQNEIAAFVAAELRSEGAGRKKTACRILLIDDNAGRRETLSALLKQFGYEAICASTAIEGFCRMFTLRPNLLIVSLEQKDLAGLEIVRAVRANPVFTALPVYLYGGCDESLNGRALEAGATRYFASTDMVVNVSNAVAAWVAREGKGDTQAASA